MLSKKTESAKKMSAWATVNGAKTVMFQIHVWNNILQLFLNIFFALMRFTLILGAVKQHLDHVYSDE